MSLKISIIGLGYVGLPLAVEFGKKYLTVGYDINLDRIKELRKGIDSTLEVPKEELIKVIVTKNKSSRGLYFTNDNDDLKGSNFYIVTVPTPTDKNNRPVLKPLIIASLQFFQAANPASNTLKLGGLPQEFLRVRPYPKLSGKWLG